MQAHHPAPDSSEALHISLLLAELLRSQRYRLGDAGLDLDGPRLVQFPSINSVSLMHCFCILRQDLRKELLRGRNPDTNWFSI